MVAYSFGSLPTSKLLKLSVSACSNNTTSLPLTPHGSHLEQKPSLFSAMRRRHKLIAAAKTKNTTPHSSCSKPTSLPLSNSLPFYRLVSSGKISSLRLTVYAYIPFRPSAPPALIHSLIPNLFLCLKLNLLSCLRNRSVSHRKSSLQQIRKRKI